MQLADELVQKWKKIPQEEHIGVWKEAAAVAMKSMLQCSFGKCFDDDSAINTMRLSYEVVCCIFTWPLITVLLALK